MNQELRIIELERRLAQAQRDLNRLPLYVPPVPKIQTLQIIGGNLQNGVQMVQYASADPTLNAVYDPDSDTVYPTGLGNGWLWVDGVKQTDGGSGGRVLVRHDFAGFTDPAMGGDVYVSGTTRTMTAAATNTPPGSPSTGTQYQTGSSPTGAWSGQPNMTATWNGSSWSFSAAASSLGMIVYLLQRG